jgi:hypothetical protein
MKIQVEVEAGRLLIRNVGTEVIYMGASEDVSLEGFGVSPDQEFATHEVNGLVITDGREKVRVTRL